MRRVASRQRLFSWDQFDATATDSSDSDGDSSEDSTTNFITTSKHDSDYMSCQPQSRRSSILNSNGQMKANLGYSKSLSLKNFSCEFDNDINSKDCDTKDFLSCKNVTQSYPSADTANDVGNGNGIDNFNANAANRKTVEAAAKKQSRANIVSPPASPGPLGIPYPPLEEYVSALDINPDINANTAAQQQMMMRIPTLNLNLNPKKRSIDAIHKSVSFSAAALSSSDINAQNEQERLEQNFIYDLHQDLQIHCFRFLDLLDIQALSITSTHLHNLLAYGMEMEPQPSLSMSTSDVQARIQMHQIMGIRNMLWWNIMQKQWPSINLNGDISSASIHINIPSLPPLVPEQVRFVNHLSKRINYPALLCRSSVTPAAIDVTHFNERPATPHFIFAHMGMPIVGDGNGGGDTDADREPALLPLPPLFQTYRMDATVDYDTHNDDDTHNRDQSLKQIQVVQFVGLVGSGDQSIRADHPFPRPLWYNAKEKKSGNGGIGNDIMEIMRRSTSNAPGMLRHIQEVPITREVSSSPPSNQTNLNFFHRLRGCNKYSNSVGAVIRSPHPIGVNINANANEPQPFVSPYISAVIARQIEIDLTPRMMAYFEVSILPRDKLQEPMDDDGDDIENMHHLRPTPDNEPLHFAQRTSRSESSCVAVGLSTRGFPESSRMPGWDSFSYGYHGDDGGIFHARGDMIRVYGPTYNVGDTIGCGVNYQNGGIFYTLNGNFLGYAWVNEKGIQAAKTDLFPTVGIDSADPIACNFGNERPFMFNFPGFVANNGDMPIPMNAQ